MTFPLLTPLTGEALRGAGVPAPFRLGQADRVRFRELDVLDHVNNAVYLSWFETFRIDYFRHFQIGDYTTPGARPVFVLKGVSVDYRAPLYLEDVYVVAGRVRAYRRTSFTMEYGVWRDGRLCATSEAVICLMEADFTTKKPLPESTLEVFRADGANGPG
ncbi:acyl-CoA thioesterase [Jannaschia seohaensis]|uniref:Acyl-CoA thioester hydrolase n=1 Tax=Jannaschia seohaensis TaxID=475081 RepID=A0A2Y9AA44_9RHOB|nr:thioesterase family protein [Jannaschia seohaensis]PWJ21011.1 acyl-CoA thioester hydrolase [Jannaschia seohaensis]SSA41421.1 acyl-CoA thioester hydrolase [Jannaschia seohaensis]